MTTIGGSTIKPATIGAVPIGTIRAELNKTKSSNEKKPQETDENTQITQATETNPQKTTSKNSTSEINAALEKRNSNFDFSAFIVLGALAAVLSSTNNLQQNNFSIPTAPATPIDEKENKREPMTRNDLISVPQIDSTTNPKDTQRVALESNFTRLTNDSTYGDKFKEYFAETARMLGFEVKDSNYGFDNLSHIPNDKFSQSMMLALHAMEDDKVMPLMFTHFTSSESFHDDPNLVKKVFAVQEIKAGLSRNPETSLDIGFD